MSSCLTTNSLDSMSQFIEEFGTIEQPKVEVKELLDVVCESGQYGSNTSATNYIEGTPRYIRITDIDDDGSLNEDIKSAEIYDDKYVLQKDDIVFARTGATVGKTYLHEEGEAIYAGYLIKYHPKESVIRPKYLKAYTHSCTYYNWVDKTQKVGAQPNISAAQYDKMPVLVPSLDEQDEYLEIYNQADKSEFGGSKSQFIEMFGKAPNRVPLSSLCDTFIDGDWIEAKDQSESGIRLIQTGNVGVGEFKDKGDKARYISEETFERLNCTEVVEGDILISRLPDPVGRACSVPGGLGKSITAVDCTIVRLNDSVLPEYFIAYTNTPDYTMQIKKVLSGTTRLRVSRANLGKISIPLPQKEEQQKFVSITHQADKSENDGRMVTRIAA